MIRVTKGRAPAKLRSEGPVLAASHSADHDADAHGYASGSRRFAFSERLYGHPTVRKALMRAQRDKCCYCEAIPDRPYAHLHVEHWRPKARVRQRRGGPALRPGYYWLAYDWENLYLACFFCNTTNKGDLFPLRDPASRARDHNGDLDTEAPMLVRPDVDDPADHVGFHDEVPVGRTAKGRRTIEVLGLDRTEHVVRLRLLNQLRRSRDVILRFHALRDAAAMEFVADARGIIERSVRPEAPFSAMAASFVARNPLPPVT